MELGESDWLWVEVLRVLLEKDAGRAGGVVLSGGSAFVLLEIEVGGLDKSLADDGVTELGDIGAGEPSGEVGEVGGGLFLEIGGEEGSFFESRSGGGELVDEVCELLKW